MVMPPTFIGITIIGFTKVMVLEPMPDGGNFVIHYEQYPNNFIRAMTRALELKVEFKSSHIAYASYGALDDAIVLSDDEVMDAIMASLAW